MSVNLNPGLFAQNFQVKNNAVKRAPSVSLTTPLAGDTVSFKKAQNNKVGFGKLPSPQQAEEFAKAFIKMLRDPDQSYALVLVNRFGNQPPPPLRTLQAMKEGMMQLDRKKPVVREAWMHMLRHERALAKS